MARRISAMLGFVIIVALALTLLWRVFVHHSANEPYDEEETVVRLAIPSEVGVFSAPRENFAAELR